MKTKNKTCKWYPVCPIKYFVDHGKLDRKWVENYCLIGNRECIRYKLEESGKYHPDNMLPNGEIKKELHY
ncbi:MAG: uracil-DNA glycosylase [Promethearchaeota archaeon]